ncbi:MAG: glycosyltransferase family 39 protein [Elusimicrobiota bacterium]
MIKNNISDKKIHIIFGAVMLVFTVFRIWYAGRIELAYDEAYYWGWSQRLAVAYYDSGAILAWVIRFFTEIFGNSEIGVRMGSIIFSLGTSVILYVFSLMFAPALFAFIGVIIFAVTPGGLLVSLLMMHDSLMAFFWLSAVFFIFKGITKNENRWWYFAGIASGFGLWSKDTMILIIPCTLLFLLLSKEHRCRLKRKEPYIAVMIMLIIFSPMLIWNALHNWVTYRHIFALSTRSDTVFSFSTFFEFLGSQLGLISPFIWLLIAGSWIYCLRDWLSTKDYKPLFILMYSLVVFLFFLALSFRTTIEGNWAGFCYYAGLIGLASWLNKLVVNNKKKLVTGLLAVAILFSVLLGALILFPKIMYIIVPKLPIAKTEVERILEIDRTNEVNGWKQLGNALDRIEKGLELKKPVFIFTGSYQFASEIKFYYKGNAQVFCYPGDRRMNQFDVWAGWNNIIDYDALFVTRLGDEGWQIPEIAPLFESIELVENIDIMRTGVTSKPIRRLSIYVCRNFKGLAEGKEFKYF